MKKSPNLAMLVASLMLLLLFVVPLWRITLEAPQYPDGISMYIWINKITGDTEYTLQNINILNHYIGMKYIEPDSIPELMYFPYIVGFMVVFGLFAAWSRHKNVRLAWSVLMVVLAGLGVYDFYLWEYDYGHNLDPSAPIKVPGMVYQPPLFGSKMLLNFNASSYPHWGGIALMLSIVVGFISYWSDKPITKEASSGVAPVMASLMLFVLITGCSNRPQPIDYGHESCDYCMMTIVDSRFGSETVTEKGKQFKFDAIECMVNYLNDHDGNSKFKSFVTAYDNPNVLIESYYCTYLLNSDIPSPMGMYLSAYTTEQLALEFQQNHGGSILDWESLMSQFDSMAMNK